MKKMMTTVITSLLLISMSHAEERATYKFSKSSSSYYQMAVQIAEATQKATNGQIKTTVEESQGSVQNVIESRVRRGNYIFSTPPGLIKKALAGDKPFKTDPAYQNIRGLFILPSLTMHFVMSAESNVNHFSDINGQTILLGKGSFGAREAKRLFDLFDVKNVKLVDAEMSAAAAAFKNNKVDGFVTASSWPTPSVTEVAATESIHLIDMTDEQIKKANTTAAVIPAGTYKGIDKDIQSASLPVGVYTTSAMSDETAYQITKAFWESKKAMLKSSPWWAGVTTDQLKTLAAPLHPGALRYYKEIGLAL